MSRILRKVSKVLNVNKVNRFLKRHSTKICTVLIVAIAIYAVNRYTQIFETFEGQKELLLLHMDGCPHCVKLMPDWNAAKQENDTGIKFIDLERNDPRASSIIKDNNIKGYPTILLRGGDKILDTYSGPRTKDGLLSYCKKHQ